MIKSGTDTDQIEFKRLRSDYILKCDQSKQDYYSSEVLKCGGDQRKMYKLVSEGYLKENRKQFIQMLKVMNSYVKCLVTFSLIKLTRS